MSKPQNGNSLPATPNIEFYKKRAKALLKAAQSGEPTALDRLRAHNAPEPFQLSAAQLAIARENGFASWPQLKHHIEEVLGPNPTRLHPLTREVSYYKDRAEGFLAAYRGGMSRTREVLRQHLPEFEPQTELTLEDACLLQARQHGFENWQQLAGYIEALNSNAAHEPFLAAVEALHAGDTEALRSLLTQYPSIIQQRGTNGNSLLSLAVSLRKPEAYKLLIEAGHTANDPNVYGWTSLHQAAYGHDTATVELLLRAGGDIHANARGDGGTPLVNALFWGHSQTADYFAQHAITPLNLRTAAGVGRVDLLKTFFSPDGTLLPTAGEHREFYRPHSGFPDWSPSDQPQEVLDEALTYAARNGRNEAVLFLLEHGANIHSDPYRGTPLAWAAFARHSDTIRLLVQHGADVNQRATFGGPGHGQGVTAMHVPAQSGFLEIVQLLIELGADPDLTDDLYHGSPAGWADFGGHPEVVEYLLALPNPGILNLIDYGRLEPLRALLDRNPELVNGSPNETRTRPLHQAINGNHRDIIQLLLERGADPTLPDKNNHTSLDLAREPGREEIAKLFGL